MGKHSLIQKVVDATADPAALVESFGLGGEERDQKQVVLQSHKRAREQENK